MPERLLLQKTTWPMPRKTSTKYLGATFHIDIDRERPCRAQRRGHGRRPRHGRVRRRHLGAVAMAHAEAAPAAHRPPGAQEPRRPAQHGSSHASRRRARG